MSNGTNVVGEIDYNTDPQNFAVVPQTASGSGPCDDLLDPTERRIALGGAYAMFFVLWDVEIAKPATYISMNTNLRRTGTNGLADSGTNVQNDLGADITLDTSHTSFSKDGFFLADYDFLFHCMGVQAVGPLMVGQSNQIAENAYLTSDPWSLGAVVGTGIPAYDDEISQTMYRAFLATFGVTFSVDSETKCDWLGLSTDLLPMGMGLDQAYTGSSGVPVVGNMNCYRVNFRARGGSSNGRDTSKRLVTLFTRSGSSKPHFNLPGGLDIDGTVEGRLVIAQAFRVWYQGCPVLPLCKQDCGPLTGLSPAQLAALSPAQLAALTGR